MNYNGLSEPCKDCPFLNIPRMKRTFPLRRLAEFAQGPFPCHKTAVLPENNEDAGYTATAKSLHCAGALIFCEKRDRPNQMMRIAERLGLYDRQKLNMKSNVR